MTEIKKPTLLLVDGHSLAFRSFYAFSKGGEGGLTTKDGFPTSVTYGFLKSLLDNCKSIEPKGVTIAFDTAEPTFRHKEDPNYKANRDVAPDIFFQDLDQLEEILKESLNLSICKAPGYEADDIIGTLMTVCLVNNIRGVMVTSDKDYLQLVSETTEMLNHKNEIIGLNGVEDRFGCRPDQVIEVLGLMGDSSDNIPGVRGVGEKTAIKLIQQFGSIEKVYENLSEVSGKSLKSKLKEGHEQAMLSRELVTIDRKVPLPIELEDLRLNEIKLSENKEFLELLRELELNTLYQRIIEGSASSKKGMSPRLSDTTGKKSFSQSVQLELLEEPKVQTQKPVLTYKIETEEEWDLFQDKIQANQKIALALYCQGNHQLDYQIQGMALSLKKGVAYFISFKNWSFYRTVII